jgi:hypothetical protein
MQHAGIRQEEGWVMTLSRGSRCQRAAVGLALASFMMAAHTQIPGLPNLKLPTLPGAAAPAPAQAAPESDGAKTLSQVGGCAIGGAAGVAIGKKAVPVNANNKQTKNAAIVGGVAGCAVGAIIAGGIYDRLSEQGRRNRERELAEAARSAQVRTYKDPSNPSFSGTVTPGPVYADASTSRECRDVEDVLADAGKGEPLVVKYCRTPPDTRWAASSA